MSDSITKVSDDVIWATRAAKRSLSPYRISFVAVVSFSFTTGTPLSLKIFSIVSLAFNARRLFSVSSNVNKIWPIFIFFW